MSAMSQWQEICSPACTGRLSAKLIPVAQAVETFETALIEIPQVVDAQGVFGAPDYLLRIITQDLQPSNSHTMRAFRPCPTYSG